MTWFDILKDCGEPHYDEKLIEYQKRDKTFSPKDLEERINWLKEQPEQNQSTREAIKRLEDRMLTSQLQDKVEFYRNKEVR